MDLNTENNAENNADSYSTSSSQIPRVLFICKICRQAFGTLKLFMCHKKRDHSEELNGIKVIVFEERVFKTEDDFYRDGKVEPPSSDPILLNEDYFENGRSPIQTRIKDTTYLSSEENLNIKTEDEKTDATTIPVNNNNITVRNCFDTGRDATLEDACQRNADEIVSSKKYKIANTEKQSTDHAPSYTTTQNGLIQTAAFNSETDQYQSGQDDQVQEMKYKNIVAASIVKSSSDSEKVQLVSVSTSTPISIPGGKQPSGVRFHVTSEKQKEGGSSPVQEMTSTPRYNTRKSNKRKINYSEIHRCDHCGKTVVIVDDLLRGDHKIGTQPVTCTVCQTKLKTKPRKVIASASAVDLLNVQNDRKCLDGSMNVVLLDPDPRSPYHVKPIKISSESPVTCKLCQTKLETEPDVKNHAENCWLHNKDRHIFCITCDKSFQYPMQLKEHYKMKHSGTQADPGKKDTGKADSIEKADENNLGLDFDLLPLGQWIQKRKQLFPDIILIDPDPTSVSYLNWVQASAVKHTTRWSASSVPLMCKLCRFKCQSENLMKCHVQICWTYNKKNHVYCVPCGKHSSNGSCKGDVNSTPETSLESHENIFCQNNTRKSAFCCRDCHQTFKTLQDLEEHQDSAQQFFRTMKQIQSVQNKNCFLYSCALCKKNLFSSHNLERHMLSSHRNEGEDQAKGTKQTVDMDFKCTEKSCIRKYKHFHTTQLKSLQSLNLFEIEIDQGKLLPEVDEAPINSGLSSIEGTGPKSSTKPGILTEADDIKVDNTMEQEEGDAGETSTTGQSTISEFGSPRKRLKFFTGGGYSELGTRVTRAMLAQAKSTD